MLNKANKLMEQRKAMIDEARQVLVVLGAEDVPVTPVVESTIVINKGKVVKVTNNEEVDRLFKENARHIRRINELAAENESLLEQLNLLDNNYTVKADRYDELEEEIMKAESEIAFKDGQIIGYKRQIKELEDKIAELQAALNAKKLTKKEKVQAMFDSVEDIELETVKEQPKTTVPTRKPKKQEVEIEKKTSPGFFEGTLTIDKKDYKFVASNRFEKPIVLGVTDDEIIQQAKDMIIRNCGEHIFTGYRGTEEELLYAEDKDNDLVVYCEQGVFKGFIDNYYFVWNPGYDVPVGCLVNNKDNPRRPLRKMNRSWGPLFVKRAEDIMALCKTLNYINYDRERIEAEIGCYSPESASNDNEVVVEVVNDVNVMSEDEELDALDI
jgi:hypothetical protein